MSEVIEEKTVAEETKVEEVKTVEERPKKYRKPGKKKVCQFCQDKSKKIDYKDANKLKKFITEKGKIIPKRQTGVCSLHQRELAKAIKRARIMALLPFIGD